MSPVHLIKFHRNRLHFNVVRDGCPRGSKSLDGVAETLSFAEIKCVAAGYFIIFF